MDFDIHVTKKTSTNEQHTAQGHIEVTLSSMVCILLAVDSKFISASTSPMGTTLGYWLSTLQNQASSTPSSFLMTSSEKQK